MKLELTVESGVNKGLTYCTEDAGSYLIGSATSATWVLTDDVLVSPKHCFIELTPRGVWISDNRSTIGTFVNSKKVAKAPLANMDIVLIGETALRVYLSGVATPSITVRFPLRIPGFTLVKKVSTDGPAEIWWASAERVDRLVTLHTLQTDSSVDGEDASRFLRAAGICAQMQHPGVVRFLTQGITSDTLWFATELINDPNLRQFVERSEPFSLDDAMKAIRQILDIAIYLYQNDVIHRNLRPESFQVKKLSDGFSVQLVDLGSAKCFQQAGVQWMTGTGEFGYPVHEFTAPEALKNSERLDHRSDIYAMGAILFYMLTGYAPYNTKSGEDIAQIILQTTPPSLRKFRPKLPLHVVDAIEHAMARDVEARYRTAQEMVNELFPNIDEEETIHIRKRLGVLNKRRRELELQVTQLGITCPPYIKIELSDTIEQIRELEHKIQGQ